MLNIYKRELLFEYIPQSDTLRIFTYPPYPEQHIQEIADGVIARLYPEDKPRRVETLKFYDFFKRVSQQEISLPISADLRLCTKLEPVIGETGLVFLREVYDEESLLQ